MEQQKYNLEKQHLKGKLHAIERINILLDKNSFHEIGSNIANYREEYYSQNILPYDGVITGYGYIEKNLYIYILRILPFVGELLEKSMEKKLPIL